MKIKGKFLSILLLSKFPRSFLNTIRHILQAAEIQRNRFILLTSRLLDSNRGRDLQHIGVVISLIDVSWKINWHVKQRSLYFLEDFPFSVCCVFFSGCVCVCMFYRKCPLFLILAWQISVFTDEKYFIIYIRPISCNKPVKYNSIFHRVKYKEDRILFGRFITWNWPYIYNKQITP